MNIIDFRIRPPFKDFLGTAMYAGAARRDGITRAIGFEPSPAAERQSVELLISEMDTAGVTCGVVVGRNSGSLGWVDNAVVKEFCETYPGRLALSGVRLNGRAPPIICFDSGVDSFFRVGIVMYRCGQRKPQAWSRRFGWVSNRQTGYGKHIIGQVQQARYGSRVIAYGADRTSTQKLGVRRDHESRQRDRRVDRRVEGGIEMVVGKGLVAQRVDQSLTAIVAAENEKVRNS